MKTSSLSIKYFKRISVLIHPQRIPPAEALRDGLCGPVFVAEGVKVNPTEKSQTAKNRRETGPIEEVQARTVVEADEHNAL
jgi:hypothetical protein